MSKNDNFTYIAACSDGTLYTGWTNDIKERMKRHNAKRGAKYTKSRTPVTLVYFEVFPTRQDAMRREAAIKKMSRKQKEKLISGISLKDMLKEYQIEMVDEMKRYQAIHKLTDNPFLNLYEIDALTKSGSPFHYYFASRNQEDKIKMLTHALDPEGIVIYAVTKELPHRLVMIRQYRYPMDDYLYELPAGLVDDGEEPQTAARREMQEETGYELIIYTGGDKSLRRPFYMAQGLTDETSTAVYGYVEGNGHKMALEDSEDIEVLLVGKEKAREILAAEKVSLRAAFFLMAFIRSEPEQPFDFLDLLTT